MHSYGESDDKIYGNIYGDHNTHMIMKFFFLLIKNYPTMPIFKKIYFIGKYFQQSHLFLVPLLYKGPGPAPTHVNHE